MVLLSFLEVLNLITIYQKAFILRQKVHCRVGFDSMPGDWARVQIRVHLENVVILLINIASRQKAFILGQMYIGGFTFILWHLTPESTPGVGPEVKI